MPTADDRVQAITDTVNRYIAWSPGGDADDLVELYADDATVEDPVGGEVHIGSQAIHGFYSALDDVERECRAGDAAGGRPRGGVPVPVDRDGRRHTGC